MPNLCRIVFFALTLTFIKTASAQKVYRLPASKTKADIVPGVVMVKVRSGRLPLDSSPKSRSLNPAALHRRSRVHKARSLGNFAQKSVLNGIYKITLTEGTDVIGFCNEMLQHDNVVYAEPVFKEKLLAIPSDPDAAPGTGRQPYLEVVKAYDAWNITKGDTSTIIGIVDTGMDLNHEDLAANLYYNTAEIPGDHLDNDGNQYTDDYLGYDFADSDPDVQSSNAHGTRVGGIAGAATDNETGIAGIGYRAKVSPLKIFRTSDNTASGSYEAILYAADNGYDIVNLSWGAEDSYSAYAQDVIRYAVLEKDMIVIAAAGNTPAELDFYPASYEHVLSVGASALNDEKASFATYSYHIDLVAPGSGIYSTTVNNDYNVDDGSSYSAPMVAGAAALVKSRYPELNAQQVMQVLRVTADDIYGVGDNQAYEGKLGRGRLNIYRALTTDTLRSVRAFDVRCHNRFGDYAFFGDTVSLSLRLTNFLQPVTNGRISFSTPSPYVSFIEDRFPLRGLETMEEQAFDEKVMYLSPDTPPETEITIRMDFSEGGYEDFQYFSFTTRPDYLHLSNRQISVSLAGNGNLGHTGNTNDPGTGFSRGGQKLLDAAGLIIGNTHDAVSDNAVHSLSTGEREEDFGVTRHIKYSLPEVAGIKTYNAFSDDPAAHPIGITVEQSAYAFEPDSLNDFFILQYRIVNTTADTLKNLHAGIYTDWNLANKNRNKALWDNANNILYVRDYQRSLYAGVRMYHPANPLHQALDLSSQHGNTALFDDELSDSAKYELISRQLYESAGDYGNGNDVATVLADSIGTLLPYESKKIAFIVGMASDPDSLIAAISRGIQQYEKIRHTPPLLRNVGFCNGDVVKLHPGFGDSARYYTDPLGENLILSGDTLETAALFSDTTFYVSVIDSTYRHDIHRIAVSQVRHPADFALSSDTLFLDDPAINQVSFTDKSTNAVSWLWDFDNGTLATLQNPTVTFAHTGSYQVSLETTDTFGCRNKTTRTLLVAERPPVPEIESHRAVCPGGSVRITAQQADTIGCYSAPDASRLAGEGTLLTIGPITKDTAVYIVNTTGPFESLKKKVSITIQQPTAAFTCVPNLDVPANGVHLVQTGQHADTSFWYLDGSYKGTGDTLSFMVTKDAYDVKVIAKSNMGCTDTLSAPVSFGVPPSPAIEAVTACLGEAVVLQPENGAYFGFYHDAALTQLIKKGTSLRIDPLASDTTVYIVGLDSILPGPPAEVSISPVRVKATISAHPDTLILSESQVVELSAGGTDMVAWKWYINGTFTESSPAPRLWLDSSALYTLVVEATNALGCKDSDTLSYVVLDQRPIVSGTEAARLIRLYPNPSRGRFTIRSPYPPVRVRVTDMSGRCIFTSGNPGSRRMEIDLSSVPAGTYLVFIETRRGTFALKLILRF